MNWAIEAQHLHKTFTKPKGWRVWRPTIAQTVIHDISLQVATGSCFGLLGINGAGKTTLTKLLTTIIEPTKGWATVAGHPLNEGAFIRAKVGLVVADERSFYWRLTAQQNLQFFASLHGLYGTTADSRIKHLLTEIGLEHVANQPFRFFSSGMKQRLAIARALLHHPQILFLDEPSRSLDPAATQQLHHLIQRLNDEGLTIFLVTHNLNEAETLCDQVAIMHHGRITAIDTPQALRHQITQQTTYHLTLSHLPHNWADHLPRYQADQPPVLTFQADPETEILTAVLDHLRQEQITIRQIVTDQPTLDQVFQQFSR